MTKQYKVAIFTQSDEIKRVTINLSDEGLHAITTLQHALAEKGWEMDVIETGN